MLICQDNGAGQCACDGLLLVCILVIPRTLVTHFVGRSEA